MPRNGSGGYSPPVNSWYPATSGTNISSTDWNSTLSDLAAALTQSVSKDGQTTMTGNLRMGGFKLTGMAAGTSNGDSVRYEQSPAGIMTTRGDLLVRGASGVSRLALGASGYLLASDGTDVGWSNALSIASITLSGALNMSGAAINEAQGADIASASTLNLDSATGNLVDVTGNNTINAITLAQGRRRTVRFTGSPTITNSTQIVLPGGASIAAQPGDMAVFRGYAGGVVRLEVYSKSNGQPIALPVATTAAAGAVQKATTAQVKAETADRYPDAASLKHHPGVAKAWVNFNGTGTVAIRSSYNVSSVTDNGTGDYTVNFATALADANYCAVAQFGDTGGNWSGHIQSQLAGSVRLVTGLDNLHAPWDPTIVNVAVFGAF